MSDQTTGMPKTLRKIDDLRKAYDWLFEQEMSDKIDPAKSAAIKQTLKAATHLNATLPLEVAKLYLQAQRDGKDLPERMIRALGVLPPDGEK